jgi:hypothetical protein
VLGYTRLLGSKEKAEIEVETILKKEGQRNQTHVINYHDFLKANLKIEHESTD